MNKPIAIGLSPNTDKTDVLLALELICTPWNFSKQEQVKRLEKWFIDFFNSKDAISFASGRASLKGILQAYNIGPDDEVLLQAFTCVALPNAVLDVGATPIFVDITNNLTVDINDLTNKITSQTKAIIVQHTFGIPADMKEIMALAKKKKIIVIEDCAHTIGYKHEGRLLGTYADTAFFSFGRDKAFSSVFGGIAITKDPIIAEKIRLFQKKLPHPSLLWTIQQLLHPIAFALILPLYDADGVGKSILVVLQKLRLLSFPVTVKEKQGKTDPVAVQQLSGPLAALALHQLERMQQFNTKREKMAIQYIQGLEQFPKNFLLKEKLPYLRFPMVFEKRDELVKQLRKHHVYLGKWYANVIDPVGVKFDTIGYVNGDCPKAEKVASQIINLPTYPMMKNDGGQKVIELIKYYA